MAGLREKDIRLLLDTLLFLSNEAVTIVNDQGEVLYWNKRAEQTYGIRRQDIVGKKIKHFFREKDLMALKMLQQREPQIGVYHRSREDKHVLINSSPFFNREGKLLGAISVEQDISQLVKLNEELSQTFRQLDVLKQEVNQVKKESPFSRD